MNSYEERRLKEFRERFLSGDYHGDGEEMEIFILETIQQVREEIVLSFFDEIVNNADLSNDEVRIKQGDLDELKDKFVKENK